MCVCCVFEFLLCNSQSIRSKGANSERRVMKKNIIANEEAQKRRRTKRAEFVKKEKVQRRLEKQREKTSRPKMSTGKKIIALGVLTLAIYVFITSGYRIIDLNLNKEVYEKKYEEKLAEKARLEKELSLIDDPKYIEQQARDKFHMLRDGEILYVFPERETVETQ